MEDLVLEDESAPKPPTPDSTSKAASESTKAATFFTDEKGNLKFVNLVVRRPFLIFFSILTTVFVLTWLLGVIVFRGGNPFADPNIGNYDIKDLRSVAYDSLNLAVEEVSEARNEFFKENSGQATRIQEEGIDVTYWVWESETETGVFGDVDSIAAMKEGLALFQDQEDYEKYCARSYETREEDSTYACAVPITTLRMYYASSWNFDTVESVMTQLQDESKVNLYNSVALCIEYGRYCELIPPSITDDDKAWAASLYANITSITDTWDGSGSLVSEEELDNVTLFAAYLMQLPTQKGLLDFGFDKNFSVENPFSLYSRAILSWGGPLDMEYEDDDPDVKQKDKDRKLLKKWIVDNLLKQMDEIASPRYNDKVNSFYFMGSLIVDVLLKIVLGDARLAFMAIIFVFIWIRVSTGSWFLSIVGMLEIVLSLPVSWFILNTVFQIDNFPALNSLCVFIVAAIGADDIFVFMDAYKQSAYMIGVLDSLETRLSYVYRRTGTAMLITSATTCSAFLCTLLIPIASVKAFGIFAAIVIFIDYVLVMSLFCTSVVIYHNKFERPGCCPCFSGGFCQTGDPTPTEIAFKNATASEEGSFSAEAPATAEKVSAFFRDKVSAFIFNPYIRIGIGLAMVSWVSYAAYLTFQLEATKETEQFLDDSHPLQRSFTILSNEFPTAERDMGLSVFFAWGLGNVDRSGVNLLLDADNLGSATYLDSFEFNEQCQTAILGACDELKTNPDYIPYIKQEDGLGSVMCFVEELGAFSALGSLENCAAVTSGTWRSQAWQIPKEDLAATMSQFISAKSCYSDDGFSVMNFYKEQLGWDGQRMLYASVSLENYELDPFSTRAESVVREQYDKMVEIAATLDESVADACGPSIMTDLSQKFVFMNNQRIYARSALESSILGISIAFTVLVIATRVIHIAFFATLSITCVLVSVTGTMVLSGWTIGTIESVLITILAGFSIDYVVHLAHSYTKGEGDTFTRIKFAFEEMGISVLNGMLTSVGASIPMFFCSLQFFARFAFFLCSTIAFSWIFANLGFMSLLATAKVPIKRRGPLKISL